MKLIKKIVFVLLCCLPFIGMSQDADGTNEEAVKGEATTKVDKSTYYTQRGEEDAKFEQEYEADNEKKEKEFWKEQKAYEKDLKKRDKKAYKAYKKGKQDAYEEHYSHCDSHCHHSEYYYRHASYYYHGYHSRHYYDRNPRYRRTKIKVRTPSIRIGF